MQLYNSLTRQIEPQQFASNHNVTIYSCGPTVYDRVHIGNLSAFIAADLLRRTITADGQTAKHVMNLTDVDDKTIRRSQELYPDQAPRDALQTLTTTYAEAFFADMTLVGNDIEALDFVRATDESTVQGMKRLVNQLITAGIAYVADDGVYFSIDAYRKEGKTYGQLVHLHEGTGAERIQNDEYDKETAHDFALWKKQKPNEPAWQFILEDGADMTGRPGWHLECSVMSAGNLGQPFDIHTGGIDLKFPHHENEIAQSTALTESNVYAQTFVHNDHILVEGRKMSKSLGNFYTLEDIIAQGVEPLAFRLLVLQSHYRRPTQYSAEGAQAATNRLRRWRRIAALRHQIYDTLAEHNRHDDDSDLSLRASSRVLLERMHNDLDTPSALEHIETVFDAVEKHMPQRVDRVSFDAFLRVVDDILGLQLRISTPDIDDAAKHDIIERERARERKDWQLSDDLRDQLREKSILVVDTAHGTRWHHQRDAPSA